MSSANPQHEIVLSGLDGANPLGFLAALGTLKLLDRARPEWNARLSWVQRGGWRARLHSHTPLAPDQVIICLAPLLQAKRHPAESWSELQTDDFAIVRELLRSARQRASCKLRGDCDYLAAFASGVPGSNGKLLRSPIVLPRSDYFTGNVRQIVKETTGEHIRRTLFAPWDYADALDNRSLRLDPSEDRRHALQLHAPTSDPARKKRGNMLGANRLALEALPLFTFHDDRRRPEAVAFHYDRQRRVYEFIWPIWCSPVSSAGLQSLLALAELRDSPERVRDIGARGIAAIFRSDRLEIGGSQKKFNLTPGMPV